LNQEGGAGRKWPINPRRTLTAGRFRLIPLH
jgi:hypothetical protein